MTWADFITAMGGVLGLFLAIFGVWKYIDAKLTQVREHSSAQSAAAMAVASAAERDLAAHRTHVAETYATKQGMHEQTSQIMAAINGIGLRIDGLYDLFGHTTRKKTTKSDDDT